MEQKTINIYSYDELSDDAKFKALSNHNEHNEMDFLEDNLTEYLGELLEQNKIKAHNKKLFYSLSYCQGDGVCFEGSFEYRGFDISVGHSGNYYHSNSVNIEVEQPENDEEDDLKADVIEVLTDEIEVEFEEIFKEICDKIEKSGYSQIEYENSEECFKECCEANEYTFRKDGEMENL